MLDLGRVGERVGSSTESCSRTRTRTRTGASEPCSQTSSSASGHPTISVHYQVSLLALMYAEVLAAY